MIDTSSPGPAAHNDLMGLEIIRYMHEQHRTTRVILTMSIMVPLCRTITKVLAEVIIALALTVRST